MMAMASTEALLWLILIGQSGNTPCASRIFTIYQ